MRMRSRVRLHRLRVGDLLDQSLDAARQVREAALTGFIPTVDACLGRLDSLGPQDGDLSGSLVGYSQLLDGLTGTVRRLQARRVPGLAAPDAA